MRVCFVVLVLFVALGCAAGQQDRPLANRMTTLEKKQQELLRLSERIDRLEQKSASSQSTHISSSGGMTDAQVAAITSAFTGMTAKLDQINATLTKLPPEPGKLKQFGDLITWLLSNGANAVKFIDGLKDLGLISESEAKDLNDAVSRLAPVAKPEVHVAIDLKPIELQIAQLSEATNKVNAATDKASNALWNINSSLTRLQATPASPTGTPVQGSTQDKPLYTQAIASAPVAHASDGFWTFVLGALIAAAAYLRVQSGGVAKSRSRLLREFAWLQCIEPRLDSTNESLASTAGLAKFKQGIRRRLQERRKSYLLLIGGEFVALLLLLGVIGYFWTTLAEVWSMLPLSVIGLVMLTIGGHVLLWRKTGIDAERWDPEEPSNAEPDQIPLPPDGLDQSQVLWAAGCVARRGEKK